MKKQDRTVKNLPATLLPGTLPVVPLEDEDMSKITGGERVIANKTRMKTGEVAGP